MRFIARFGIFSYHATSSATNIQISDKIAKKIEVTCVTSYKILKLYNGRDFKACEARETAVYYDVNEDFEGE